MTVASRRRGAENLGRNVEHGVAPVLPGDSEDRLARLHHLAQFGGSRRDRPLDVGLELGEAHPVLGDVELGGRVVDSRLRGRQPLICCIEIRPGGEAPLHEVVLTVEIVLRLDLLGPRGGERRLRRAERIEFVLRIEFRQHLVRLDLVADPALPLDDPPADAEGEIDLVFGPDIAGEHDRIANHALFDSDSADRARLRRFGLGFLIAASREHGERENADKRANARLSISGAWSQGESSHGHRAGAYRARAEGATIRDVGRSALSRRMGLSDGGRRRLDDLHHRGFHHRRGDDRLHPGDDRLRRGDDRLHRGDGRRHRADGRRRGRGGGQAACERSG